MTNKHRTEYRPDRFPFWLEDLEAKIFLSRLSPVFELQTADPTTADCRERSESWLKAIGIIIPAGNYWLIGIL